MLESPGLCWFQASPQLFRAGLLNWKDNVIMPSRIANDKKRLVEDYGLVSIVMPAFNCEDYVFEALESVFCQTYDDWELIVVNDCSSDSTKSIVERFCRMDERVGLINHESNLGAAASRATGIEAAKGEYIAFFDADDVWLPDKLLIQLDYMNRAGSEACFTDYETIEHNGAHRNIVSVPKTISYDEFLMNTVTCSHTMVVDVRQVPKRLLIPPVNADFDFPEDLAVWLQILKAGHRIDGCNVVLAKNRKHGQSRSSSVAKAIRRTWNQYRRIEGLSLAKSAYCLFWQLVNAARKRL